MKTRTITELIGALTLILMVACSPTSSSRMDLDDGLELQRPYHTDYTLGYRSDTLKLDIVCNTAWEAQPLNSWIQLSATEGEGNSTLYAYVEPNYSSSPRQSEITISLKRQHGTQFSYSVEQGSYSSLLSLPGYEKGAGFAYDITAPYCKGMTWQIFDVEALDFFQNQSDPQTGAPYRYGILVSDNSEAYNEEQYASGSTLDEIEHQLSASATLDLDTKLVDVDVTGNITVKEWEKRETVYGVKRTKRIVFVRDIQFVNCLAAVKAGQHQLFAPGFYVDWKALEECNPEGASQSQCEAFLDKWGIAFVCRSCLGGSFDYEMEIEKTTLGEEITIEAALNAEIKGGIMNAQGNVEWKLLHERIKNSYSADLHIYGGDIQYVSILTDRTGSFSADDFQRWSNSIVWGKDRNHADSNNAVLVDIKIASIANLFTGATRQQLEKAISYRVRL